MAQSAFELLKTCLCKMVSMENLMIDAQNHGYNWSQELAERGNMDDIGIRENKVTEQAMSTRRMPTSKEWINAPRRSLRLSNF